MNNQNDEALKRKVLVSRLNGWVSRYSLRNKFKRFGRIRDIKFDPAFATIEFTKQSHAVAAEMFMNGSYLDEQRVKVRALGFVRVPPPPSIFPGILQDHGPSQNVADFVPASPPQGTTLETVQQVLRKYSAPEISEMSQIMYAVGCKIFSPQ